MFAVVRLSPGSEQSGGWLARLGSDYFLLNTLWLLPAVVRS